MPIQPMTFNPLSFDQVNAGIKGYQEGQQIAQTNLQTAYAPIIQNQQLQKQQLANALAQVQLQNAQKYQGQQQAAQIQNTQAQSGLYGAQGQAQTALANQTNVKTTQDVLNNLRQLQGFKQSIALNGGDTSSIDALIAQNQDLLGQSAGRTGYGTIPQTSSQPSSNGAPPQGSLPLSPQQMQILQSLNLRGGAPGTIGGNATGQPAQNQVQPTNAPGSGLNQLSQTVGNNPISPQDQQLQNINRSNLAGVYAAQSGSPQLTSIAQTQMHLANEGNPIVNALDKSDAATYQQARGDAKNAAELDNLTSQYEQVLKTIPPALFAPGINWKNSAFSGAIQHLQALSQQMIAHDAELTGVNKNRLTGSEFAQIGKSTAMPSGQFLSAINGELGTLHSLANTHTNQFNSLNDYLNQHGNLSGFKFGALSGNGTQDNNNTASTNNDMIRIKGQDGKLYNIPSGNLAAALKRGAMRAD